MSNNRVIFCHRPKLGVSIGATKIMYTDGINGDLYISYAITNRKKDQFSRKIARQIITGRLDNPHSRISFSSQMSPQKFINRLRKIFKPTHTETDDIFNDLKNANEIETEINHMIDLAVNPEVVI